MSFITQQYNFGLVLDTKAGIHIVVYQFFPGNWKSIQIGVTKYELCQTRKQVMVAVRKERVQSGKRCWGKCVLRGWNRLPLPPISNTTCAVKTYNEFMVTQNKWSIFSEATLSSTTKIMSCDLRRNGPLTLLATSTCAPIQLNLNRLWPERFVCCIRHITRVLLLQDYEYPNIYCGLDSKVALQLKG